MTPHHHPVRIRRELGRSALLSTIALAVLQLGAHPWEEIPEGLLHWILNEPYLVFTNLLILSTGHLLIARLIPWKTLTILSLGIATLFVALNQGKIHFTQIPILPQDLLLAKHAPLLLAYLPTWGIALISVGLIGSSALLYRSRSRLKSSFWRRAPLTPLRRLTFLLLVLPGLALSGSLATGRWDLDTTHPPGCRRV